MTAPSDYIACPGTGKPGIGSPSVFRDVRCSVCGRLIAASRKAGKVSRHADARYYRREGA